MVLLIRFYAYPLGTHFRSEGNEGTFKADVTEKVIVELAQVAESLALPGPPHK